MQILKYEGNDKYIVGLAENDKENYIFFAKIDTISLNKEIEEEKDNYGGLIKFISSKKCTIEFLLKINSDNSFIHILKIEDKKEYETICRFLRFIL